MVLYGLLSLLQILPLAAPSAQMTRLMSMEELASSVIGRQNAEEARPRLLRVDPPNQSSRIANSNSSKRQSHLTFHVIDFIFCKARYFTYSSYCVLFLGRRGERRRHRGRERQKSRSDRMTLSFFHKR